MSENQLQEPWIKQVTKILNENEFQNTKMDQMMKTFRNWNPSSNKVFRGHSGPVWSCAITSDNKIVFSGSEDKTLKMWDAETQECLHTFEGHINTVNGLELIYDNKYLVSGDWSGKMFIWDWKEKTLFKELTGHTAGIFTIGLSRDESYLISGSGDFTARIWRLSDFENAGILNCNQVTVYCQASNSKFSEIICAGQLVKIFNFPDCTLKSSFDIKSGIVQSMGLTRNDKYLVLGTRSNIIKVLNYNDLSPYHNFTSHENWIRNIVISNDNKHFISVSADKSIRIFNILTKSEELNLEGSEGYIFGEYLSKDGQYLITGASDKLVRLWKLGIRDRVKLLKGHTGPVMSLDVTSDNKFVVTGSEDKTVRVWSIEDCSEVAVLKSHSETVWSVAVSQDSKYIASAAGDRKVILWDFASRDIYAVLEGHRNTINSVTFNSDASLAVSAAMDKIIIVWDVVGKNKKAELEGHTDSVFSVKVSFDDQFIISGASDYTIRIWDINTLQQVEKIETKAGMIESIAISHDGKYLVFGDRASKVNLWNWESKSLVKKFSQHSKWVRCVNFSSDGNLFLSASNDSVIRVWNALEERQEFASFGHSSRVRAASFTNDGKYIISAGEDPEIRIWNIFDVDLFEMADSVSSLESFLFLAKLKVNTPCSSSYSELTFGNLRVNLAHFYAYMNEDLLLRDALNNGVEIKRDVEGHSPLFYALNRASQNCIDVILKYMNRLKSTDIELYLNYSHALRDDFERLLSNHSVYLPDFIEEIFYTVPNMPNFAVPKTSLPILSFSDNKKIELNSFIYGVDETPQATGEVPIEFKTLPFAIPFNGGSAQSIILLKNITTCPNSRILQTKFIKSYIGNKWESIWPFIFFLTLVMWANIIAMAVVIVEIYIISWKDSITSDLYPEIICFIFINLILTVYEIIQVLTTGSIYFTDFWNIVDILRSLICLFWGFMCFFLTQEDLFFLTWVMVVLNFFRGLTGFRAFSTTRYYTRLITRAFNDSLPFLFIFFYSTFAFGVIYFVSLKGEEKNIFELWSAPYQLNMGETMDADKVSSATYIYFMMASVINVILLLNLLISILGDSFDSFQIDATQIDYLEQAELILEIESLMFWKRNLNERKFMQTCQVLTVEENQEWEGRSKMMMTAMKKMKYEIKAEINELKKMFELHIRNKK